MYRIILGTTDPIRLKILTNGIWSSNMGYDGDGILEYHKLYIRRSNWIISDHIASKAAGKMSLYSYKPRSFVKILEMNIYRDHSPIGHFQLVSQNSFQSESLTLPIHKFWFLRDLNLSLKRKETNLAHCGIFAK